VFFGKGHGSFNRVRAKSLANKLVYSGGKRKTKKKIPKHRAARKKEIYELIENSLHINLTSRLWGSIYDTVMQGKGNSFEQSGEKNNLPDCEA